MAKPLAHRREQFIHGIQKIYGIKPDRFGHFKFVDRTGYSRRLKITNRVWRFERRVGDSWVRNFSGEFGLGAIEHLSFYMKGCKQM